MDIGIGTQAEVQWREFVASVAEQLWDGWNPRGIIRHLQNRGLDYVTAVALVDAVEEKLRKGGAL